MQSSEAEGQSPAAPPPPPASPPAPPWAAGQSRRRRLLTREAIVETALAIIDREGCDAVSMRRVAHQLGVAPSSLYQHITNREELLQAAVHHVLDDASGAMPDTGDWIADLRTFFVRLHERLRQHSDLVRYAFADNNTMPTGTDDLRDVETLLQRLTAVGLGPRQGVLAFDRLMLYTIADAYEASRLAQQEADERRREWVDSMRSYMAEVPADEFPLIAAHHALLMDPSDDDAGFLFGLDLMLAGLATQAAAS